MNSLNLIINNFRKENINDYIKKSSLPEPIKNGTGNFTSNIATLLSIPNFVLQGNLKGAGDASASFLINSTFCAYFCASFCASFSFSFSYH